MRRDIARLRKALAEIAGEAPSHIERSDGGYVAFFGSELAALRVAYAYRDQRVTCEYREALETWSVTVLPRPI